MKSHSIRTSPASVAGGLAGRWGCFLTRLQVSVFGHDALALSQHWLLLWGARDDAGLRRETKKITYNIAEMILETCKSLHTNH